MREFRQKIDIRFADIDAYHHVNNAVYFTYMEHTRTQVMLDYFLKHTAEGIQFVVSEATCRYLRPIRLEDELEVIAKFLIKGKVRFEIEFSFVTPDNSFLYAKGKTTMACVNRESGKPQRIPPSLNEMLELR